MGGKGFTNATTRQIGRSNSLPHHRPTVIGLGVVIATLLPSHHRRSRLLPIELLIPILSLGEGLDVERPAPDLVEGSPEVLANECDGDERDAAHQGCHDHE